MKKQQATLVIENPEAIKALRETSFIWIPINSQGNLSAQRA
jgi:hypothetical protein